ncbi:MAG: hypothetical protein RLZZ165_801 [Bacteroidota bacterium]
MKSIRGRMQRSTLNGLDAFAAKGPPAADGGDLRPFIPGGSGDSLIFDGRHL